MMLPTATRQARVAAMTATRGMASLPAQTERMPGVKPSFATAGVPSELKTTRLDNGVLVASQDDGAPVASLAITVAAGYRHETHANAGVVHYLRNVAFQTAVKITRETELHGARLGATSDREAISYTAQFMRNDLGYIGHTVAETIASPNLFDWEVRKQAGRVSGDAKLIAGNSDLLLVDDLHRAAFRGSPLGRPVSIPASRIGKVSVDDIVKYRENFYTGDNTIVVAVGVDHDALVAAVGDQMSSLPGVTTTTATSQYFGGEAITPADGSSTGIALGFRGVPIDSPLYPASLVLRQLFGGDGSSVKWSTDSAASRVGAAVAKATSDPFTVSGFTFGYADEGLVGVHLAVSNSGAGKAVVGAAGAVKEILGGSFSAEELSAAKAKARLAALSGDRAARVDAISASLLKSNHAATPESVAKAIEGVTKENVAELLKHIKGSKPVLAIRGCVDEVPFLESLGL